MLSEMGPNSVLPYVSLPSASNESLGSILTRTRLSGWSTCSYASFISPRGRSKLPKSSWLLTGAESWDIAGPIFRLTDLEVVRDERALLVFGYAYVCSLSR